MPLGYLNPLNKNSPGATLGPDPMPGTTPAQVTASNAQEYPFTDINNYGWSNFSPDATNQAGFYNQMAQWYQGQQAPQMQRTAIDWSGNGQGMNAYPQQSQQSSPYPNMQGYPLFTPQMAPPGPNNQINGMWHRGADGAPVSGNDPSGGASYPEPNIVSTPPSGGGTGGGGGMHPMAIPSPQPPGSPSQPLGTLGMLGKLGGMTPQQPSGAQQQQGFGSALNQGGAQYAGGATAAQPNRMNPGFNMGQFSQVAPLPAQYAGGPQANSAQKLGIPMQGLGSGDVLGGRVPQSGGPAQFQGGPMPGAGMGPTMNMHPTPQSNAPPSSMGQFANPLYQQGQASRATGQGIMDQTGRALDNTTNNPLYGNMGGSRDQQQGYINQLNNVLSGNAPSLAQTQLRQGVDANIAAQNALAASAGPGQANIASRAAMNNAAIANQNLSGQSAALRAQEEQNALSQLGGATTNMRGADITALGQSQQNTQSMLGLMSQQQTQQRAQDLQASGMSYQNALAQAQLEAEQNANQAQLESSQNAQNSQAALGLLGMGQATQSNDLASRMHYYDLMSSKYANDKGLAQQASQFNTQQNNLMAGTALSAGGALLSSMISRGGGGGLLSDERRKRNIDDVSGDAISEFLAKLNPYSFEYKHEPSGLLNYGIMAQDLEKSRIGKTLVMETPVGKMVSVPKAVGALLATNASLAKRVDALEGK